MNKKKKFQEAAAIISIVLSSIFTFIFLISFAAFDRAFEIIKEQVGSQLSAEELEMLKSTTNYGYCLFSCYYCCFYFC